MARQFLSNELYSSVEDGCEDDDTKSNYSSASSRYSYCDDEKIIGGGGGGGYAVNRTFRSSSNRGSISAKNRGTNCRIFDRNKKSFAGRVVFTRESNGDKALRELNSRISSSSTATVCVVKTYTNGGSASGFSYLSSSRRIDDEAYESFSDNEDEEIISDYLRTICEKEAEDIVDEIKLDDSTFNSYLRQEKMDKDTLFATIRAVSKICRSGNYAGIVEEIYDCGLPHAIRYYLETSYRRKKCGSSRQIGEFFENLISYYFLAMKVTAAEERELWEELIVMTERAVRFLNGRYNRFRETEIIEQLQNVLNGSGDDSVTTCAAPVCETFRDICILLTGDDLDRAGLDERYLREIKLIGRYASVEDYLETLFRLERENFAAPLRFGIREYLQSKSDSIKTKLKCGSVKIYENVRFDGVTRTRTGRVCLLLNFDFSGKLKRFKWEATKRLALGSLLLLSANSFESFFYAIIVERTLRRLQQAQLLVILDDETELNENLFESSFVMAETEVRYEQYRGCMRALKCFSKNSFPFKEYLIDAKSLLTTPKYITQLLNCDGWPLVNEFALDLWQCAALKLVLLKNLCLIRGAPGSGKTFLTVQLVRILLQMSKLYPNVIRTPFMIIYATDKALDMFLMQISQFLSVSEIVRIAGRSNDHKVKQFDLRGRVKLSSIRAERAQSELVEIIEELEKCRERIDAINAQIEAITSDRGIVKYSILSRAFGPSQKQILTNDDDLLDWLLDGKESLLVFNDKNEEHGKKSEADRYLELVLIDDDEIEDEWSIENDDEVGSTERNQIDAEFYCCTMASLEDALKKAMDEYASSKEKIENIRGPSLAEKKLLEERIKTTLNKLNTIKLYGKGGDCEECKSDKYEFATGTKAWTLPVAARWICYWRWINILKTTMLRKLAECEYEYRKLKGEYEKAKRREDLLVAHSAKLVGATIAEAVAFQDTLKELQPAIVICEEANQILETNLVAVLTNECQHLILLGDEKQLKPDTAEVFKLQVKYNYGLSLFDRMLNNHVESVSLNKQYRMRPEIANLLKLSAYSSLEIDNRVYEYEPIAGMAKYLYFFDHNVPEQEDGKGLKRNIFEAEFAIELTRYLVEKGNNAEKITLLSSHEGQVYNLKEMKRKYEMLRNVNCFFVDDYAGRTNDIAILCLVRSNDKGQIGLLGNENRTYVSLSRATKGLYIVGNMEMVSKCSKLWHELKSILQSSNAIGTKMALHCETHDKVMYVSAIDDFERVRRNGCTEICGQILPRCGHTCKKSCHFFDKEHVEAICEERCSKKCSRNLHQCELRCNEKCQSCNVSVLVTLPCGHDEEIRCDEDVSTRGCSKEVTEKSPLCGHTVKKICGESFEEAKCTVKCGTRLECGHSCSLKCHRKTDPDHSKYICRKDCSRKCEKNHKCTKKCHEECGECAVTILRTLDCGHEYELPCSGVGQTSNFKCRKRCLKSCPSCKTICAKKCYQQCPPCQTEVVKVIEECGHEIKAKCSDDPPKRDVCRKKCERTASCGHRCRNRCLDPCVNWECDVVVRLDGVKGLCGHNFINVICSLKDDVAAGSYELADSVVLCDVKCNAKLACGHSCQGTCGECYMGIFHKRCGKKCAKTLVCGHKCKSYCEKFCPPCSEPCPYRCKHANCSIKCGVVCSPCSKKCEWQCKHSTCTRICGAICNRKPCYERCKKKLKCEHSCIGFCGEPCPPKCRVCDKDKLSDMPGDLPYKSDARFIVLVDCNHVFESCYLEKYFDASSIVGEIIVKGCPLCSAPITKTLRFMNYVKQMYEHVNRIKSMMHGEMIVNSFLKKKLTSKFVSFQWLCNNNNQFYAKLDMITMIYYYLEILGGLSKFESLDFQQLKTIEICSKLMEGFMSRVTDCMQMPLGLEVVVSSTITHLFTRLFKTIAETGIRMNIQHIIDSKDELLRFNRLIDFITVLRFTSTHPCLSSSLPFISVCDEIRSELLQSGRYSATSENKVHELFAVMQNMAQNIRLPIKLTKIDIKLPKLEDATDERTKSQRWFLCSEGHYYYAPKNETNCPDYGSLKEK